MALNLDNPPAHDAIKKAPTTKLNLFKPSGGGGGFTFEDIVKRKNEA